MASLRADHFEVDLGVLKTLRNNAPGLPPPAEYDVMILHHFSRPPKVDFGDTFQAKSKRRHIKVVNEEDSDVILRVDKVPAHFTLSTDSTEIVVTGHSHVFLSILWEPVEEGGHIGVIKFVAFNGRLNFRLHVSVFGKCVRDSKVKKKLRKKPKSSQTFYKPSMFFQQATDKENIAPVSKLSSEGKYMSLHREVAAVVKPQASFSNATDSAQGENADPSYTHDQSKLNHSVLGSMHPQLTSTQVKIPLCPESVKENTSTKRSLQLSHLNNSPESAGGGVRVGSPDYTYVVPASAPVFFTPGTQRKSRRKHRRRSNTYNTDSPVTPRELIPSVTPCTGIAPLSFTPKHLLTPLRAALFNSNQKRHVSDRTVHPSQETTVECEPTVVEVEEHEDIGPLTPISQLANHSDKTNEQKRRSTFALEEATLTNTPTISPAAVLPSHAADSLLQTADSPLNAADSLPPVVDSHMQTEISHSVEKVDSERAPQKITVACSTKRRSVEDAPATGKYVKISERRRANASTRHIVKSLRLKRPTAQTTVKQTLPYATHNRFYDNRWMEKQERGFTRWINHLLTPCLTDDCVSDSQDDSRAACEGVASLLTSTARVKKAPTKEVMSLRTYTALQKMNALRQRALQLFQNENMTKVMMSIEVAVDKGKLQVLKNKSVHADIGLRNNICQAILSYSPLWLRIGLEVILGEAILLRSSQDTSSLKNVIMNRILGDPHISERFRHHHVANLFKPGYESEVGKHILKKLLMLIYFLDVAKTLRLIDYDPCLFVLSSEIKSSSEMLLFLAREILTAEGDIIKHLGYLGYRVSYHQRALDEYQYGVVCLRDDLRDGVRLVRMMEILTKDYSLSKRLKVPAPSLTNKRRNVQIALDSLTNRGVDFHPIKSEDIVIGHREKTLQLLWIIIANFQITKLVDVNQLSDEIGRLSKSLAVSGIPHTPLPQSLIDDTSAKGFLLHWAALVCSHYNLQLVNFSASFSDGRALCYLIKYYQPSLLPRVCDVTTLSVPPSSLSNLGGIQPSSLSNLPATLNSFTQVSGVHNSLSSEELVNNDKSNFKAVHHAVRELGGIPIISTSADMVCTVPDERSTCLYVTYICNRLLELREETWAARVIQRLWRLKRCKQLTRDRKCKQVGAAVILQRWFRGVLAPRLHFLSVRNSVRKLQTWYRSVKIKQQLRIELAHKNAAARVIQTHWRVYRTSKRLQAITVIQMCVRSFLISRRKRSEYLRLRQAAVFVQCRYRTKRARRHFQELKAAVVFCQTRYRTNQLAALYSNKYQHMKRSAVKIQTWWRSILMMKEHRSYYRSLVRAAKVCQWRFRSKLAGRDLAEKYNSMKTSTICIQRRYRALRMGRKERVEFLAKKLAVTKIQQWFRLLNGANSVRTKYIALRNVCIFVQRKWRAKRAMHSCRKLFVKKKAAACHIQRAFRGWKIMRYYHVKFLNMKRASKTIQCWFRSRVEGARERTFFLSKKCSALQIQRWYRSTLEKRVLQRQVAIINSSAMIIQRWYRSWLAARRVRSSYNEVLTAVKCMQHRRRSLLMMRRCQADFIVWKSSALKLQLWYRSHALMRIERSRFTLLRESCVTIQRFWRSRRLTKKCRDSFLSIRSAAKIIQNRFRRKRLMKCDQRQFQTFRHAAILIQRWYFAQKQGHRQRHHYLALTRSAVVIQRYYKGFRERQRFMVTKAAALCIQQRWRARKEMVQVRTRYHRVRHCAIAMQKRVRCRQLANRARLEFVRRKEAVIRIQVWYRAIANCKRNSAVQVIQQWWSSLKESSRCHKGYLSLKNAVTTIQRRRKAMVAMRMARNDYLLLRSAAITIQSHYRSVRVRKHVEKLNKAAVRIQSCWRCYTETRQYRMNYSSIVGAVVKIQSVWRASVTRRKFYIQIGAACTIQSWWRTAWSARLEQVASRNLRSIIKIQSWYRMVRIRKQYLACLDDMLLQVTAAVIIQSYARVWLARREAAVRLGAIITLQALWRGRKVRQTVKRKETESIRKRLRLANKAACSQKTLRERNATALHFVLKYKMIGKILEALRHLIVTTKYSAECRFSMAESGAVREIVGLMRSCNRSEPHKDILELSLEVINNLALDPVTAGPVYSTEYMVDTILMLMSIYIKSGPQVFQASCVTLTSFIKHDTIKQRLMRCTDVTSSLQNLQQSSQRNYEMLVQKANTRKVRAAFLSLEGINSLMTEFSSS